MLKNTPKIKINSKATHRLRTRHPWVWKDEIQLSGSVPESGAVVSVQDSKDRLAGCAFFNPISKIALRFLSFEDENIDEGFWRTRLEAALSRRPLYREEGDLCRLVFSESDGLPGLIVDRYGPVLSVQMLSAGMERLQETILGILQELVEPQAILLRNDSPMRVLEGMGATKEVAFGEPELPLPLQDGDLKLWVDPWQGQKTGTYLDQRENQRRLGALAKGRVLDAFCYQGGFALHCAAGAEEVLALDSSAEALELLTESAALNQMPNVKSLRANVFDWLKNEAKAQSRSFDLVILDPPAFAKKREDVKAATRAYKEINLRGMKLVKPGGLLFTCSCSYNMREDMWKDCLREAAADAGRTVHLVESRTQASDHPISLTFPESHYLKATLLRVE
ncbi:MAG: class I SAM-dependent rRNA methyltransferase [Candidatus Omnitrophica bacterium]|nr:class I SAM-dependent rRNA methyltransferase [Candidatus Omnitrophota bacterium]